MFLDDPANELLCYPGVSCSECRIFCSFSRQWKELSLVNNWQGFFMYSNELKLKIMSNSKVLVGFLVGAAVGGALGLLLAPEKGSETRKKIIETGNDLGDSIAEFGGTVKDKFNEVVDGVKGSFSKTKGSMS
jgi:phage-related minor tail protein